jgi:hypothetical protein
MRKLLQIFLVLGGSALVAVADCSADTAPQVIFHSNVYRHEGRFAAWPANFGVWSWGDEILTGFSEGQFLYSSGGHSYTGSLTEMTARSVDGGNTWTATAFSAVKAPLPDLDFTHPETIMRLTFASPSSGYSSFYISQDKGVHWFGPYSLPSFGMKFHAGRTDYLVYGAKHIIALISGKDVTSGTEGSVFAIETLDGCKTWNFKNWVTPRPSTSSTFYIQPSSVRLSPNLILTAVRKRDAERSINYIPVYISNDNGQNWSFYTDATPHIGGSSGNPPSLVKLRDGRIVLSYGRRMAPNGIRARLSLDDGKTWDDFDASDTDQEVILRNDGYNSDLGYTRSVQRNDGRIVTIYYMLTASASGGTPTEAFIGATIWDPGSRLRPVPPDELSVIPPP